MRRREFIALLAGATASVGYRVAAAQGPTRARVGFISGLDQAAAADFLTTLRDGLAAHGYVEPRTFKMELLFADYVSSRIPDLVEDLERQHVDVIVTHAAATGLVVKARRTIPVVYEFSADPVSLGIATDLSHPLFNATGISLMLPQLNSKRLELLREIFPDIRRVAVIANPLHPGQQLEKADSEAKAHLLGIDAAFFATSNRQELDAALRAIDADPPQAILVFSDAFAVEHRQYIVNFAMSRRLPVVSGWAAMADTGALCTYGPRVGVAARRVAYFVDRILKGAKPADLPIEQPTVLELVVNLNTAKTLGIIIPPGVLVRADRVIE